MHRTLGRPTGEIRQALRAAFAVRGAATWREVAPMVPGISDRSRADLALVRRTVGNMVNAGELQPVGYGKVAGSQRWHAVYESVHEDGGIEALTIAMRAMTAAADRGDDGMT